MTADECTAIVQAFLAYQGLTKQAMVKNRSTFTKSQTMVLNLLSATDSLRMSAIAEHLAVSKEQASRAVKPLAEQGLVERHHDARDRKVVNVSLSAEGKAVVDGWHREYNEQLSRNLQRLSEGERNELVETSRRAVELLRHALDDDILAQCLGSSDGKASAES